MSLLSPFLAYFSAIKQDGREAFKCSICNYTSTELRIAKLHMCVHTGEKPYACEKCGKKFARIKNYTKHVNAGCEKVYISVIKQDGKKAFKCSVCSYTATELRIAKLHMCVHTGEEPHACDKCGKLFTSKKYYNKHVKAGCEKAGKKALSSSTEKLPLEKQAGISVIEHDGKKAFKCNICSYTSEELNFVRVHLRVHTEEKRYACEKCQRKFASSSNYHRHVKSGCTSGIDPSRIKKLFRCGVCNYTTAKFIEANRHLRVHTGEKPYTCEKCGLKSSLKYNHTKHVKLCMKKDEALSAEKTPVQKQIFSSVIEHEGKEAFKCSVCNHISADFQRSKMHLQVHIGKKPFRCEKCGKKFMWKHSYNRHSCGKVDEAKYNRKATLIHIFKCKFCAKEFLNKESAKWHSSFCSENLKTEKILQKYLDSGDSWQCGFCGEEFEDDQTYLTHSASCSQILKVEKVSLKKIAEDIDSLTCEHCGQECPNKELWIQHLETCGGSNIETQRIVGMSSVNKKTECLICHEEFANEEDCSNHLLSCHHISKAEAVVGSKILPVHLQLFKCHYCNKMCQENRIKQHLNLCTKRFKTQQIVEEILKSRNTFACPFCNAEFDNGADFINHSESCSQQVKVQKDSDSKPSTSKTDVVLGFKFPPAKLPSFKCDYCNEMFAGKRKLNQHLNICTKQYVEEVLKSNKTNECLLCSKVFDNENDLIHHSRSCGPPILVQKDSDSKPSTSGMGSFICKFCDKSFQNESRLKKHSNFCRATFRTQQMVEEIEKGIEVTFECRFCGNKFTDETKFVNHSNSCDLNPETRLAVQELLKLVHPY